MRITLALFSLLLAAGAAGAQKTDSVWIKNGDRITGEVKSLSRALLKYSTDDLGTISIEWDKVVRIMSTATYEVQLSSGQKYYGTLGLASNGWVVLGIDTLSLHTIVTITPIRRTLVSRLDGYLDLGISYQKANQTFQLTSSARVAYRAPKWESILEGTTFREDRDDASETARLSASFTERYLFADRWSAGGVVGFARNDELDLAGRVTLVGFGARTLARSNHVDSWATGGLVVARERYVSSDSVSHGLEALIGISYAAFRYDQPKLNATLTSQAFPSFTVPGRVRWQTDVRVSYELVKDFMVTLTVFDTFDSKPQSAEATKNDFGTTLAISWTF